MLSVRDVAGKFRTGEAEFLGKQNTNLVAAVGLEPTTYGL